MTIPPNHPSILQAARQGQIVEHNRVRLPSCAPCAPDPGVCEKDFQALVLRLAIDCGWECYHTFDSRKSREGYPDLTCWRERLFLAELKSEYGKQSAAQKKCLASLKAAGQEVYLWRPGNWNEIVAALAPPGAPPPPPSPSGPKAA